MPSAFQQGNINIHASLHSSGGSDAISHNNLANLNAGDYQHLTATQATDLTDGGETTLHSHAAGAVGHQDNLTFHEGAAPDTPADGHLVVYAKSDGKLYYKNDAGTEVCLSVPTLVWKTQAFTSSGTWSKPAALYGGAVFVRMIGGGGGGGGNAGSTSVAGGGGGSGSYVERWVEVSGNVTVTIGDRGNGVLSSAGGNGKDTSFGSVVAKGGGGGGIRGGGSGGQNGNDGVWGSNALASGSGGGSPFGLGGRGVGDEASNSAADNTGAGGGGAGPSSTNRAGGNGGTGICIVEWQEEA